MAAAAAAAGAGAGAGIETGKRTRSGSNSASTDIPSAKRAKTDVDTELSDATSALKVVMATLSKSYEGTTRVLNTLSKSGFCKLCFKRNERCSCAESDQAFRKRVTALLTRINLICDTSPNRNAIIDLAAKALGDESDQFERLARFERMPAEETVRDVAVLSIYYMESIRCGIDQKETEELKTVLRDFMIAAHRAGGDLCLLLSGAVLRSDVTAHCILDAAIAVHGSETACSIAWSSSRIGSTPLYQAVEDSRGSAALVKRIIAVSPPDWFNGRRAPFRRRPYCLSAMANAHVYAARSSDMSRRRFGYDVLCALVDATGIDGTGFDWKRDPERKLTIADHATITTLPAEHETDAVSPSAAEFDALRLAAQKKVADCVRYKKKFHQRLHECLRCIGIPAVVHPLIGRYTVRWYDRNAIADIPMQRKPPAAAAAAAASATDTGAALMCEG